MKQNTCSVSLQQLKSHNIICVDHFGYLPEVEKSNSFSRELNIQDFVYVVCTFLEGAEDTAAVNHFRKCFPIVFWYIV